MKVERRIFLIFLLAVFASALLCFPAKASESLTGADSEHWYFNEDFSGKTLKNNQVRDKKGKVIWQINKAAGQKNTITETGALEIGSSQYFQRAVLDKGHWGEKQDFAMEFTINVQKLGNEGHSDRPIAVIIPRSKDKNINGYYAVTYFMENTEANQFRFKWAIINTASPAKMKPLVEGFYLLRENVDYTARLVIQNTPEDNVNIRFYIDGPTNPVDEFKPLLEYTDSSEYKILSGVTGPAFGTVGYFNDGWGVSPVVRYDNIRLFDIPGFLEYEKQLKEYADTAPEDIQSHEAYGPIKYLINKGLFGGYSDNTFRPDESVSVAQFVKMLINLKGERPEGYMSHWADIYTSRGMELGIIKEEEYPDPNKSITRNEAALMLFRYYGARAADTRYLSFIKDNRLIPTIYKNAALYCYLEGYLRLDDDYSFNGNMPVSRSDAAAILLRILDAGYRKANYKLELPSILSSGAVLQGNKKIPVWGRGICGETITVKFKRQVKTTAVKDGHWYLELDPEPYGGPYTLNVKSTRDSITLRDIKIGEVFIVAGQSNAEMYLHECNGGRETRDRFKNKKSLRFYSGEQITAVTPNFTSEGKWEEAYNWILDYSPAIGTFFAEELFNLNQELENVTIGIIPMTYGGTTIEVFMPNCIAEESVFVQRDDEPIRSGFWNGFMEPIAPFAAKAIIYYQGENSTHLGYGYENMLRDYIRGLRTEFRDPCLPVMLVQLAGFGYNSYESDRDEWPIIRAVQMKVANTTGNTGLVTAMDLSDPDPEEIHPKEKKEIGRRLAYLAMQLVYEKDLGHRSPQIKSYRFEGNKVIAEVERINGPLVFKEEVTEGFEILDENYRWHPARAVINETENSVEIWHDSILSPLGARYAWVNNPRCSLYSSDGLPVLPFRIAAAPETTGANNLKISGHSLASGGAIVNVTRNNQFRVVEIFDADNVFHLYAIGGQAAGDTIEKFKKLVDLTAGQVTNETVITLPRHGLSVGDWIRNNTRGWQPRRVDAVYDENTIGVSAVSGQSAGDVIELFKFTGVTEAE